MKRGDSYGSFYTDNASSDDRRCSDVPFTCKIFQEKMGMVLAEHDWSAPHYIYFFKDSF